MISELKDDDILDFLMTSDFEGDYSPEELKYLLTKWRYFYRVLHGSHERFKTDNEGDVRTLKTEVENLKNQLTSTQINNVEKDTIIDSMKKRKLTWKERFSGQIIIKTDENK